MTALQALSSALLSLHEDDDPPSPPSDEFQFESEYMKSLLKQQRTPSPIIHKPLAPHPTTATTKTASAYPHMSGKENLDRYRTPVTMGAQAGRTVLGARDVNSGFNRSVSAMSFTSVEEKNTPGWKSSSYHPLTIRVVVGVNMGLDNLLHRRWDIQRHGTHAEDG